MDATALNASEVCEWAKPVSNRMHPSWDASREIAPRRCLASFELLGSSITRHRGALGTDASVTLAMCAFCDWPCSAKAPQLRPTLARAAEAVTQPIEPHFVHIQKKLKDCLPSLLSVTTFPT